MHRVSIVYLLLLLGVAVAQDAIFIDSDRVARVVGVRAAFGNAPSFARIALSAAAAPALACDALDPPPTAMTTTTPSLLSLPAGVLVVRGNCTFEVKARNAERAGFALIVVANSDDSVFGMSGGDEAASVRIAAIMIGAGDGARLRAAAPSNATVIVYARPLFDSSGILLFVLAVCALVAGAWWSSEPERLDYQAALDSARRDAADSDTSVSRGDAHREEVVYIDMRAAVTFVCTASVTLILLFYLIEYLIYVLIAFFALAGALSVSQIAYVLTRKSYPQHDVDVQVRCLGAVNALTCYYFAPASFVALWWAIARHASYAFVLQDAFGVALLMTMQRSIRLPNIKISAALLIGAFVYDVRFACRCPLPSENRPTHSDSIFLAVSPITDSVVRADILCFHIAAAVQRVGHDQGGHRRQHGRGSAHASQDAAT